jgi:C4-type Zn-finger protein
VFHLLGDPISTIEGLLQRLQRRKLNDQYWERFPAKGARIEWKRKNWKSIALILHGYDEYGQSDVAREKFKSLYVCQPRDGAHLMYPDWIRLSISVQLSGYVLIGY